MSRKVMPDVAITTDVLVGFPGETEDSFNNTFRFLQDTAPMRTHIFTFSKREGTAAYRMANEVPANVAKVRYERLNNLAQELAAKYTENFIGKSRIVLVESQRDRRSGKVS